MSAYTDSAARAGIKGASGSDDRELFARNFSDDVLEAWDETFDFLGRTHVKPISSGKSDVFPVIGRKRDAADHIPGEIILGGTMEHNEVEITLDKMTVDSVFIPEIDELMAHYPLATPYAKQLGESLASVTNTRIAQMMVLASRVTTPQYTGGPIPGFYTNASIATDASKLEEAHFKAVEWIKTYDIGGGEVMSYLPWAQFLLLTRYSGLDYVQNSGSADRSKATVGPIAGINVKGTNSVPRTNVTTGLSKYQGDFTGTYGVISNPQAVGTLRRRGKKVVIKDVDERLGTQIIVSQLEGHGKLRPECSFEISSNRV